MDKERASGQEQRSIFSDLKFLYELTQANTIGNQVAEKTLEELEELMTGQKMVNVDTGTTFFFDPKRKDWFSKKGIAIDNDKKPFEKLYPKDASLKPLAKYNIEMIGEGEKNPFVN